jgi:hypothetical protein
MKLVFCYFQRMLGHIHVLQQICLVQLVLQDHYKFQVRDDQYVYNIIGSVSTKTIGITF